MFDFPETNCRRVRQSADDDASSEGGGLSWQEIRLHLKICQPCSEIFADRLRFKRLLQRAVRREAAPPVLHERIKMMIRQSGEELCT